MPAGLQDGQDVLLDGELAEDGGFLGQVAHAQPGALVHRQAGDVARLEPDRALVRLDDADDHVEGGGLAGAVRAEQADNLAGRNGDGDAVDHAALAVFFHQLFGGEQLAVGYGGRRRVWLERVQQDLSAGWLLYFFLGHVNLLNLLVSMPSKGQ